jgi:hypothetical protein
MQIGFNLPISGPLSSPESMTRIAQQGEALGYDYLTLTDHLVLPNLRVPGYPYSESGRILRGGPGAPARATYRGGLHSGPDHPDSPRAGGDGRASPTRRARRQDAVDDRCSIRRAPRRRDRRRLGTA